MTLWIAQRAYFHSATIEKDSAIGGLKSSPFLEIR